MLSRDIVVYLEVVERDPNMSHIKRKTRELDAMLGNALSNLSGLKCITIWEIINETSHDSTLVFISLYCKVLVVSCFRI